MAEAIDKSPTPGTQRAAERVKDVIREGLEDRYPPGTAFVAVDVPGASKAIKRYSLAGRPMVLMFPDGTERRIEPTARRSSWLTRSKRFRLRRGSRPRTYSIR